MSRGDRGLCAGTPTAWDLDQGGIDIWAAAIATCWRCPLLDACATNRDELYPGRAGPKSVIWAGVAYNERGWALDVHQLRRRSHTLREADADLAREAS